MINDDQKGPRAVTTKRYMAIIIHRNKLECFVTFSYLYPSLLFAGKAGTHPRKAQQERVSSHHNPQILVIVRVTEGDNTL